MDFTEKQRKKIGQYLTELKRINECSYPAIGEATDLLWASIRGILNGGNYPLEQYRAVARVVCGYSIEDLLTNGEEIIAAARKAPPKPATSAPVPPPDTSLKRARKPRERRIELLDSYKEIAGPLLNKLRNIHGLKIKELVPKTDLKAPTLEGIFAGNPDFSKEAYQKVSNVLGGYSLEELARDGERIIADAQKTALETVIEQHNVLQQDIDAKRLDKKHSKVTGELFTRVSYIRGIPLNQLVSTVNRSYRTVAGIMGGNGQYANETVDAVAQALELKLKWDRENNHCWVEKVTLPESASETKR